MLCPERRRLLGQHYHLRVRPIAVAQVPAERDIRPVVKYGNDRVVLDKAILEHYLQHHLGAAAFSTE